jgi:hypothetical protein
MKPPCCHGGAYTKSFEFKKMFPTLKKCETTDDQNDQLGKHMTRDVTDEDYKECTRYLHFYWSVYRS